MNAQEIFDTVHKHLIEQGGQAIDEGGCVYRTDGGLKCAVGCLIPDDLYDRGWEGQRVDALVEDDRCAFLRGNQGLLNDLQTLHDNDTAQVYSDDWENYINGGMKKIAEAFGLKFMSRMKQA